MKPYCYSELYQNHNPMFVFYLSHTHMVLVLLFAKIQTIFYTPTKVGIFFEFSLLVIEI